jgi:predicted lipoprotein with Yx(FWY)xxD motif
MHDNVVRHRHARWVAVAGLAAVGGVLAVAPTVPAHAGGGTTEAVVQVVDRAPFGAMLATTKGRSLYKTMGPCTGQCLVVWPPLVMASGKTVPTGVSGLGTVTTVVGGVTRLQVTYKGKPLYKFDQDSGSEVNGNGVGGFKVAKVR